MNNIVQRDFIIGDTWLYYKIYTGNQMADKVLANIIKPITNDLLERNIISKWFFIRFADPHHHIRLRLHFNNSESIGLIINRFKEDFKNLMELNVIWKIQLDTYKREIERYGVNSIEIGEDLFYYDSKMIVDFISIIGDKGEEGEELRWLFSIRAIDSLLNTFKYNIQRKKNLFDRLSVAFEIEFNADKRLRKDIGKKYRVYDDKIRSFMLDNTPDYKCIIALLKTKENNIEPLVKEILKIEKKGILNLELDNLLNSYIHMLMNRLFKSKNRLNELVIYNFLLRYYKSRIALESLK